MTEGGDNDLRTGTQVFELGDHTVDETQRRLSPGPIGLDLDIGVEAGGVHEINEVPQGRERFALEPGGEPTSGVDARQVGDGQVVVPASPVRSAIQGRVVADDDRSVGDDVNIRFHPAHLVVHCAAEGSHSVLRGERAQTTMPDDHALAVGNEPIIV